MRFKALRVPGLFICPLSQINSARYQIKMPRISCGAFVARRGLFGASRLMIRKKLMCCPTRIRTSTNRTKICRTTIILSGNKTRTIKREAKIHAHRGCTKLNSRYQNKSNCPQQIMMFFTLLNKNVSFM